MVLHSSDDKLCLTNTLCLITSQHRHESLTMILNQPAESKHSSFPEKWAHVGTQNFP